MTMTADQRKQRARLAINSRWARPLAREEQAEAARAALERRFRKQVDPDGVLDEETVQVLIASARKAQSAQMHLAKARKKQSAQ